MGKEVRTKPIQLPELSPQATAELDELYRTTRNVRLRSRAQMILLAAEQHLVAANIAAIVHTGCRQLRR
jgi:hypothetical protein